MEVNRVHLQESERINLRQCKSPQEEETGSTHPVGARETIRLAASTDLQEQSSERVAHLIRRIPGLHQIVVGTFYRILPLTLGGLLKRHRQQGSRLAERFTRTSENLLQQGIEHKTRRQTCRKGASSKVRERRDRARLRLEVHWEHRAARDEKRWLSVLRIHPTGLKASTKKAETLARRS